MLRHRERMEENEIAPLTWEGKRSAAAAPDAEVVDKPTRRRFSPIPHVTGRTGTLAGGGE